jgi:hypothetical protein
MATSTNAKPARATAPVVIRKTSQDHGSDFLRLLPAALASALVHAVLFGLLFLMSSPAQTAPPTESKDLATLQADPPRDSEKHPDPLITTDIDPAASEPDTDINYSVERKAEVSVPGQVQPNESVGIVDAPKDRPPVNLPAPAGFGVKGQGGAIETAFGSLNTMGQVGGYGLRGVDLVKMAGTFGGRSGATRDFALREGGGTKETEAAVAKGLRWLQRVQSPDGSWRLDGPWRDRGTANDIAGTAFGLLPMLGAGKTHKAAQDNPYDKVIEKALLFLIRKQDKKTGNFGGGMYAHGLASIAMCEAYGLSQDPALRRPAQMAVNFIVNAQHDRGGWRYSPGEAGDTSVVGWQVMALKSGQMAGLDVPEVTMKKAVRFLNEVGAADEGYGYTGPGSTPTLSAVGLLCRQYLQAWGPQNIRMIKGIDNHIKTHPPSANYKNMYYYYYATQVMHHFGGSAWKEWNEKMRDLLVKQQDKDGSWSSDGESHGSAGGRLMKTSLALLTMEVYYRHLPLYYRDAGMASR